MNHSLEVLGAVESLLLLHEEDIRHERNAANVLAVCWVGERVALIVGEVGRIVFSLAAGDLSRHFGDDCELLVLIHGTMYRLYFLSAGPSLALCMCDMRGARPSGSEVLIELMVSSAFFLTGKESINDGRRAQRPAPRPLGSYVLVTYPSIVAYNRRAIPPDRISDALRTWSVASVTDGAVMMMPGKHANHLPTHYLDVWVTGGVPFWDEIPA